MSPAATLYRHFGSMATGLPFTCLFVVVYISLSSLNDCHLIFPLAVLTPNCDFEHDCSGWQHSIHDVGALWMRHQGYTSSIVTGPRSDHTFMNSSGHYLYIEASSASLQIASFVSPLMTFSPLNRKISFWYFMFGRSIGCLQLSALCKQRGDSSVLWMKCENQGFIWRRAVVDLFLPACGQLELHFTGALARGFQGDIAIDDIEFNTTFDGKLFYVLCCVVVVMACVS